MQTKSFTPIGVTFETIDSLIREQETDAVALYMAYTAVAHWQKQYRPYATGEFMKKRLGWGDAKFSKAKKVLVNKGLIADVRNVGDDGKVTGWYIQINHIVTDTTPPEKRGGGECEVVEKNTPSTLNTNKVQSTNSKVPCASSKKNKWDGNGTAEKKTTAVADAEDGVGNEKGVIVERKDADIIEVLDYWKEKLGCGAFYANKTQREAVKRLVGTLGTTEKVKKAIDAVFETVGQPFAPSINTPLQLEEKMATLRNFYARRQQQQVKNFIPVINFATI